MKTFGIRKYGKEQRLVEIEVAVPVIKNDEVLVAVHAASINQLDVKVMHGEFKMFLPYQFPLILGYDVAGIVSQVGSGVRGFKVGDEVFARASNPGGLATFIAVREADLALKPANVTMEEAASFPLVALTVWQAFTEKAVLKKGQKVFIQAGSGGVGTVAIQIAKHLGATVATTTSSSNADFVKRLGADIVIDYKTQDFENILKDFDLVLNSQDSKTLAKSFRILKSGGQVVSISGPPDANFASELGLSWLMRQIISWISRKASRQAKVHNVGYSFLFMRPSGKQLAEIGRLIERGIIKPTIDKVFQFDQAADAMTYIQSGHAKGKVVVTDIGGKS